jgi:hypothetical protein
VWRQLIECSIVAERWTSPSDDDRSPEASALQSSGRHVHSRRTTMSSSRVITDHEEIRHWAEERGAKPATVKSTTGEDDVGVIRLDFPGYSGEGTLEEISWEQFFEKFEQAELALIVQDATAEGERSNFNKLVSRNKAA